MDLSLEFLGAAENVTGSRHLLKFNDHNILVDCGLYQERDLRSRNWEDFGVNPRQVTAMALTHAHLDHCGLIPRFSRQGFAGPIYCTQATAEIARIVLLDSGSLQEEDAEYKRRRHEREGRKGPHPELPLYTAADAEACFHQFKPVKMKTRTSIADGVEISFHEAGHIFGSSIVQIDVSANGEKRTILFTGDLGRCDKPILQDPAKLDTGDYILLESTYGDREHPPVDDIKDRLEEVVNSTFEAGGNIVVPSFAIERSQEILYYMNELLIEDRIPHIMTFLDSPMAIRVTDVFRKHPELYDREMKSLMENHDSPFSFDGLVMTPATRQSKSINHIKGTIMVIAGSGMCTGGRIKHHLVNNITRPESTILFIGYQAVGTLGRHIVEGAEKVRILGQHYQVKARIAQISGFSAHADRNEALKWLKNLQTAPKTVFCVHGEKQTVQNFRDFLEEKTDWDIRVARYKQKVKLA